MSEAHELKVRVPNEEDQQMLELEVHQGLELVGWFADLPFEGDALLGGAPMIACISAALDALEAESPEYPVLQHETPEEVATALGTLFGDSVARELGWGWVLVEGRYQDPFWAIADPEARWCVFVHLAVFEAMSDGKSAALQGLFERLKATNDLPPSESGELMTLELTPPA